MSKSDNDKKYSFKKLNLTFSKKAEAVIFFIVTLLNLYPVLSNQYFPTLDGAAHLYNANIIKELILHPEGAFANYFEFNSSPVPNWTGHFILTFFRFIFPAFLAEKCLLIIYLVGLPYAFRSLVKRLNPKNALGAYFIFPFCYTSIFLLGFYNFSIGILLMFVLFSAWIKWESKKFSWKKFLLFSLLFTLLYFSHLVVFAITVAFLISRSFYLAGYDYCFKKELKKPFRQAFFNESGFLLLTALLPLILLIKYFLNRNFFTSSTWLSNEKLIESLTAMESLIGFSYDLEKGFAFYIFCSIVLLVLFILFKRVLLFAQQRILIQQNDYWLFAALGVLILYFLLPNESGNAGFVSIRLNLIFYLLLICWIASQQLSKLLLGPLMLLVLFCNFKLNDYYHTVAKDLNQYTNAITDCSKYIEYNSTVIPLNYDENWLTFHFSNYLGVERNIIVLDNYESTLDYFPIRWSKESFPHIIIGENPVEIRGCTSWLSNLNGNIEQTNYVFIMGKPQQNDCYVSIKNELNTSYQFIYSNDLVELYKRK